jgi:hypothetical protein
MHKLTSQTAVAPVESELRVAGRLKSQP